MDHRDAQARTIIDAALGDPHGVHAKGDNIIDALRAEGWSIVKLRKGIDDLFAQDLPLYTITEGEV